MWNSDNLNERLAMAARMGDESAMMELWERVGGLVRNQSARWAGHKETGNTAEDYRQTAFLAFLDALGTFPGGGVPFVKHFSLKLRTEFESAAGIRTCKRDALQFADSLDTPTGGEGLTLAETIPAPDMTTDSDAESLSEPLRAAMATLTPTQRVTLEMVYCDGIIPANVARRRGVSDAAVRRTIRQGLARLKRELAGNRTKTGG